MNIILVGPVYPYRGGIAHYTTQLALSCRAQGHTCKVISFKRQYPRWLYPGGSDLDPSKSAVRIDADYLLDPIYPWTWLQGVKKIHDSSPDLVVLQWWTTFWSVPFGVLARQLRSRNVPVYYLVHNVLPHEEKPFDRWLVKWALSPAKGYIVQSEAEQERFLTLLPNAVTEISPQQVYSILNSQRLEKEQARQKLGISLDHDVLLFFGIVRPYKGLLYLIQALSILMAQGKQIELIVSGDFWEDRKYYEEMIKSYGLTSNIRIDDRYIPDEEAALLFSAADVLVAPYVDGTQSAVAGMALGFGLPIIITDIIASGLSQNDHEMVWVIPPGDVNALAETILIALDELRSGRIKIKGSNENWGKLVKLIETLIYRGK